jgi:hypothetical protein
MFSSDNAGVDRAAANQLTIGNRVVRRSVSNALFGRSEILSGSVAIGKTMQTLLGTITILAGNHFVRPFINISNVQSAGQRMIEVCNALPQDFVAAASHRPPTKATSMTIRIG